MNETDTVSPLRQRMIEDIAARKLDPHTQRSHIYSCKRFAVWLKRSPDTATADEVQLRTGPIGKVSNGSKPAVALHLHKTSHLKSKTPAPCQSHSRLSRSPRHRQRRS